MHTQVTPEAIRMCADISRLRLQGAVAKLLLPVLLPVDLAAQLTRRLLLWLPEAQAEPGLHSAVCSALPVIANMRPMFSIAFIKTVGNGWPVGQRHGARLHSCPFCSAENNDKLNHYIRCDRLWDKVAHAAGIEQLPTVLQRLGLRDRKSDAFTALHISLDSYQSIVFANFPVDEAIAESARRTRLRM